MPTLSSPSSPPKRKRNDTSNESYPSNGFNADQSRGGFDQRVPLTLAEHNFPEMTPIDMADLPPAQEMQEKCGGGLLGGSAAARFERSNQGSMDRIGEETEDDSMEISHTEYAE